MLSKVRKLAKTGRSDVQNKVGAVLKELLRRNGISREKYIGMKEGNKIVYIIIEENIVKKIIMHFVK